MDFFREAARERLCVEGFDEGVSGCSGTINDSFGFDLAERVQDRGRRNMKYSSERRVHLHDD